MTARVRREDALMGEFEELDAVIVAARAARSRHRAEEIRRQTANADFHARFREWADTVAAPTLEQVAEHVRGLYEHTSVHVHHPDEGAGHRESVDLNIDLMGQYLQLTYQALLPELAVGVSENHGVEAVESLESLTADEVRRRAIELVKRAVSKEQT